MVSVSNCHGAPSDVCGSTVCPLNAEADDASRGRRRHVNELRPETSHDVTMMRHRGSAADIIPRGAP